MIRRTSLAAISLCIAACASSGPEAPAPAETNVATGAESVASDASSASGEGVLEEGYAPPVEVTADALSANESDVIVCRMERQTGTRMSRRVCRTRAEIDARQEKDQDTLRRSRATQSGGGCQLNRDC